MSDTKPGVTPANAAGSSEPMNEDARKARATDKDIGNWKYEPWGGLARWTHAATRQESFDQNYVKANKDL